MTEGEKNIEKAARADNTVDMFEKEKCCICGQVKQITGKTFNHKPICIDCVERYKGS